MPSRPDLAALLVEHKVAGVRAVDRVIRARGEVPVWRAIVDGGVASEAQVFELLRDHAKFPVATAKVLLASPPSMEALTRLLPKDAALARGILPFEIEADGARAQIAMVDPTDEQTLRDLARTCSLKQAKVYLAERATLSSAVERAYSAITRFVIGPGCPSPIARASQRVTGSTPRIELEMKSSSVRRRSFGHTGASSTQIPSARARSISASRVIPGNSPADTGGVTSRPPDTKKKLDELPSVMRPTLSRTSAS